MHRELHPRLARAKRGLGQARGAGEVADVDVPIVWLECKHYAEVTDGLRLRALEQGTRAEAESRAGREDGKWRFVVAVCKADRRDPTATMWLHQLALLAGYAGTMGALRNAEHPVTLSLPAYLAVLRAFLEHLDAHDPDLKFALNGPETLEDALAAPTPTDPRPGLRKASRRPPSAP